MQDYYFEQRKSIYDIILKRNEGISITLAQTCNDPEYGFSHGLKNVYYSFKNKKWSLYTDNEIECERIFKNKDGLKIDMNEFISLYKNFNTPLTQ